MEDRVLTKLDKRDIAFKELSKFIKGANKQNWMSAEVLNKLVIISNNHKNNAKLVIKK